MRELCRDYRANRVQSQAVAGVMMRKLAPRRVVGGTREEREEHLVRRHADAECEPKIAIIRHEDILTALERHCRARLHALVPLACRGKRNLALAIELETPILERSLHEHVAKHRDELLVAQPLPLEAEDGRLTGGHAT